MCHRAEYCNDHLVNVRYGWFMSPTNKAKGIIDLTRCSNSAFSKALFSSEKHSQNTGGNTVLQF